jgi:hypothetical protein
LTLRARTGWFRPLTILLSVAMALPTAVPVSSGDLAATLAAAPSDDSVLVASRPAFQRFERKETGPQAAISGQTDLAEESDGRDGSRVLPVLIDSPLGLDPGWDPARAESAPAYRVRIFPSAVRLLVLRC